MPRLEGQEQGQNEIGLFNKGTLETTTLIAMLSMSNILDAFIWGSKLRPTSVQKASVLPP